VGNAITLEPWESYTDTVDIHDCNGTFTIKAMNSDGQVLATQAVEVNFCVHSPPRYLNSAPFRGSMRFPEGTATRTGHIFVNNQPFTVIQNSSPSSANSKPAP
jgi:hypothetical protein